MGDLNRPSQILVLVRHGEPSTPRPSPFIGQLDPPLSRTGRQSGERLARYLGSRYHRAAIVSSDLVRASDSADLLSGGRTAIRDDRFREESLGPWEGMTPEEVSIQFPLAYTDWIAGRSDDFGGREGFDRVANRAAKGIYDYLSRIDSDPLIVVSHVNTILALVGSLLGIDRRLWSSYPSPTFGQSVILDRFPGHSSWRLRRHLI